MGVSTKTKILFLATIDTPLEGHAYSVMKSRAKDKYDTRLFVLSNEYGNTPYSLIGSNRIIKKIYYKLLKLYLCVKSLVCFRKIPTKKQNSEYCYFTDDFIPSYANIILKKLDGFIPEIISVHWSASFVGSATLRDLYKKTKAKIVLCTTDEQWMMGGCHYSVDCEGYKTGCWHCPALVKFPDYSHYQLENKRKNLSDIPIFLTGVPYALKKAMQESYLFRHLDVEGVAFVKDTTPRVIKSDKRQCRDYFKIKGNIFVVLCAAAHVLEKRKGMKYALQALRLFQKTVPQSIAIIAGNIEDKEIFNGLNCIFTGRLSESDLFKAYCASDCYLSSTIADTGPIMVNFSISLGIPVVSFPIGVAETLVVHKKTGYIAKYKDSQDMGRGLEYIYGLSDEEYTIMQENCKKEISKYSDVDNYNKIVEEYL